MGDPVNPASQASRDVMPPENVPEGPDDVPLAAEGLVGERHIQPFPGMGAGRTQGGNTPFSWAVLVWVLSPRSPKAVHVLSPRTCERSQGDAAGWLGQGRGQSRDR